VYCTPQSIPFYSALQFTAQSTVYSNLGGVYVKRKRINESNKNKLKKDFNFRGVGEAGCQNKSDQWFY